MRKTNFSNFTTNYLAGEYPRPTVGPLLQRRVNWPNALSPVSLVAASPRRLALSRPGVDVLLRNRMRSGLRRVPDVHRVCADVPVLKSDKSIASPMAL